MLTIFNAKVLEAATSSKASTHLPGHVIVGIQLGQGTVHSTFVHVAAHAVEWSIVGSRAVELVEIHAVGLPHMALRSPAQGIWHSSRVALKLVMSRTSSHQHSRPWMKVVSKPI